MDHDEDCQRAVRDAVAELLGPSPSIAGWPDLDLTRPNIHDNKTEFLREVATVESALHGARMALRALYPEGRDTDQDISAMIDRLEIALDRSARRSIPRDPPNTISGLLRKNMKDTGFYMHTVWSLLDLMDALEDRLDELNDQRLQFWDVKHRAPNYYARAIALRLARLYAREKGKRPTFGTASDGGHPSTDFGRSLERIFIALKISRGVKHPAKWAINQLSEEDLLPRSTNALRDMMGISLGAVPSRNALAELATKGSKR